MTISGLIAAAPALVRRWTAQVVPARSRSLSSIRGRREKKGAKALMRSHSIAVAARSTAALAVRRRA